MAKALKDYKSHDKVVYGVEVNYAVANYTQNYLSLKLLLNLQEKISK